MAKATGSNTVRFIHTADWQIGKPYAHIGDPQKRSRLQSARVDSIEHIGAVAAESGARFVVVAGDLFDSPTAERATVSAACSAIGQLGLPVVVIPGNHDHGGPGSIWRQDFFLREQASLAPNLVVLLTEAAHELETAIILPCPLLTRSVAMDPTAWLRSPAVLSELSPDKPRIVLAHGTTEGFATQWDDDAAAGPSSNRIDLDQLPDEHLDYVALGDWHGTKQVGAKAWYSGTPELDRFPKGGGHDPGNVLVVDVRRTEAPIASPTRTGRINWLELDFDLPDDSALVVLEGRLTELLGQRTDQDVLSLSLTGSIGIEGMDRLEKVLDTLAARLLRLKLDNRTRIAPSDAEIEDLTLRTSDPLIARVARQLVDRSSGADEEALIARLALRELHAVRHEEALP